ncbi:CHASE2 domain-containing protein [Chloroflexota bacterium]
MAWAFKRRHFFIGIVISLSFGACLALAFHFNLLYTLQQRSSDLPFQAASLEKQSAPDESIIIVGIDDQSLEKLGHFPSWSRSYYAELTEILSKAGARVIVFDLLFAETAPYDEELTVAIEDADNVVLSVIGRTMGDDALVKRRLTQPSGFIRPISILEQAAISLGHANIFPDADWVVRRIPIVLGEGDDAEPALAMAAVAKYLRRPDVLESSIKDNVLLFAGRSLPLIRDKSLLINYIDSGSNASELAHFHIISFVDVIDENIDLNVFKDKIVIVGATASGLGDIFWTPVGKMTGVEIHAVAMHTILGGNFLRAIHPEITIASILVLSLICGLLALRLKLLQAISLTSSLLIAYFLVAFALFDRGIVLNMLYPPLAVVITFAGVNLYNVTIERTEKNKIAEMFGRYTSQSVADKILKTLMEGELKLGGEEQDVTVAFADVCGFTGISEKMPPEKLVEALNAYLSVIIKVVQENDGMINKFDGDSVMAVWNVPVPSANHALEATRAAVGIQRALADLRDKEKELPPMEFRIAVNTGKAVAGNMGSKERMEYSVIGDIVNTAAHLASLVPGGKVWIGAETFDLVSDFVRAKPLLPLPIKGKQEQIQAYEIEWIEQEN